MRIRFYRNVVLLNHTQALMTSSPPSSATDAFICPLLKTGRVGCVARFDRALYQLELSQEEGRKTLDLGFSGSRVLERLLQSPGDVVSREELMRYAWENRVVGQGSLSQQIYTLRQILFDGCNQIIQTLPRRGYLFNPQYLHSAQAPSVPKSAQAPAVRRTVILDLPTPHARLSSAPAATPQARRPRHIAWLTGLVAVLLTTLGVLGALRVDLSPMASVTHARQLGHLEILYVEAHPRLLDALVSETETLVGTMSQISERPARLVINLSPGFYEFRCLRDDGKVNWLKVHKGQILNVATVHLNECLG